MRRSSCFHGRLPTRVARSPGSSTLTNMLGTLAAIFESKDEGVLRQRCKHRPIQYLNNILEQDQRAIKRRVNAKQHFRRFSSARKTIEGYEAMHMIRKGQARWVKKGDVRAQTRLISKLFGLIC